MDGFVSNECGRFLFFDDTIAAAAAIPTGPDRHKPLQRPLMIADPLLRFSTSQTQTHTRKKKKKQKKIVQNKIKTKHAYNNRTK